MERTSAAFTADVQYVKKTSLTVTDATGIGPVCEFSFVAKLEIIVASFILRVASPSSERWSKRLLTCQLDCLSNDTDNI